MPVKLMVFNPPVPTCWTTKVDPQMTAASSKSPLACNLLIPSTTHYWIGDSSDHPPCVAIKVLNHQRKWPITIGDDSHPRQPKSRFLGRAGHITPDSPLEGCSTILALGKFASERTVCKKPPNVTLWYPLAFKITCKIGAQMVLRSSIWLGTRVIKD